MSCAIIFKLVNYKLFKIINDSYFSLACTTKYKFYAGEWHGIILCNVLMYVACQSKS